MPWKDWNVGDFPTAAEFDIFAYQADSVFTLPSARDAAIPSGSRVPGQQATTTVDGVQWLWTDTVPDVGRVWRPVRRFRQFGTHVPTLTATTTDPTLGTGNVRSCRWTRNGSLATVAYFVAFGSSGASAGSGTYELSLPPECPAADAWWTSEKWSVGVGVAVDASPANRLFVGARIQSASRIRFDAAGLNAAVTDSNLFAWAVNDVVFTGTISYECSEAN